MCVGFYATFLNFFFFLLFKLSGPFKSVTNRINLYVCYIVVYMMCVCVFLCV